MDARVEPPRIDPAAWEGLEDLREGLRAFLARQCHDENDLDDVIQETFLRAARYRCARRVRSLRPWTNRIALNVLADARRRVVRSQALVGEDGSVGGSASECEANPHVYRVGRFAVDADQAQTLLARTLAELRRQDRALLDSYYGDARGTRAAAEACGVPRRVIKVRLFRARRRLQRALRQRVSLEARWSALAS